MKNFIRLYKISLCDEAELMGVFTKLEDAKLMRNTLYLVDEKDREQGQPSENYRYVIITD